MEGVVEEILGSWSERWSRSKLLEIVSDDREVELLERVMAESLGCWREW